MAQTNKPEELARHRSEFIKSALETNALKFGTFTLKSGRVSPYFFNSGLLSTGPLLSTLSTAYAALIASEFPPFDVLFGPAYKGIALAASTSVALHSQHGIDVGFGYNRKEAKAHGEGGWYVGAEVKGKRVLILDDVVTAGTAIREAVEGIKAAGGEVVGVVLCVDREEVGKEGEKESAVGLLENELGGKVRAVVRMRDLMGWLEGVGRADELAAMQKYRDQYGVKDV